MSFMLLALSLVFGLLASTPSSFGRSRSRSRGSSSNHAAVGDECTPSSRVNISCGQMKLLNVTVTELSVEEGNG